MVNLSLQTQCVKKQNMLNHILKFPSVLIIRYLQKRYRTISIRNRRNQTDQVIAKLVLIQSILYYFKNQFSAWGFFHPDCGWSEKDEKYFRKLFPQKEGFEELDIVVWHNPEAVTYYQNTIYRLSNRLHGGCSIAHSFEIKKELTNHKKWN